MATELLPAQLSGLATIPEKGNPPNLRIPSAVEARKLSDILKREDLIHSYSRSLVNGLVNGALPFTHVSADLAWIPNVNFLAAAALIEKCRVPYYQLLNVENYAETIPLTQPDHPDKEKWAGIAAKFFHDMITRWPEWYWEYQGKDFEMLKHGKGVLVFEDYPDWRFRSLDCGALKVPKESPSCLTKRIPYLCFYMQERVHTLYQKIKDVAAAEKAGWNVQNVRDAIRFAMKGINALQSWDYYERILLNCDLSNSYSSGDIINCVTMLAVEFDGKVSKMIYTEGAFTTPEAKSKDNNGFLFCDVGKFDDYTQACVVFFQELGEDRRWHSVKGQGAKAYNYLTVKNQMNCRMLAAVEMASGLTVQVADTKSKDSMYLTQRGMVTYIMPGVKVIQNAQPAGFLDGPITTMRVLDNQMAENLGQNSPRSLSREDGRGEQPTARQVTLQAQSDASLSQGQISLHCVTMDSMFNEMFRRASTKGTTDKEARQFQDECLEAGIPPEVLFGKWRVRANRLSGYGSSQMRSLSDEQMLPVLAMLPEEGKNNFLRDHVGGIKGADKVDRYVPQLRIPGNDEWMANTENEIAHQGGTLILTSGQDDVIHCTSHLADADKTLSPVMQAIQQGQSDPQTLQSAYAYVQIMGPHLEEHIQRLSQDQFRKKEAKMFQDQLNQIVAFNSKLHGAIRDAQRQQQISQEQQQQASALGDLDQAKVRSAQTEDSIKTQKAQADLHRKDAKMAADMRLKTIATLNTIHLNRAKTATDIANQNAKAASEASNGNN